MAGDFRPGTYNIKLWRGNTWQNTFKIYTNGVAENLSTAEVRIQLRVKPNSSTAVVTLTEASGITVGGVANNEITVSARINIDPKVYYWDVLVIKGGIYKTYLWGKFEVYEEITEPA